MLDGRLIKFLGSRIYFLKKCFYRGLILIPLFICPAKGQIKNYTVDARQFADAKPVNIVALGGSNPGGEKIAVNNFYITKGGVPIIPITGEIHYSRYPHQYWEESIRKMKAGGINMIATYVFWNIHEEKEGQFNWSGDRDLRKFIELCAKNKIMVVVRIGPFDHGEIRNGGIPDWILGKPLTIRTNDPLYLHYVELLYNEIGKQLKNLYYKDGGPIVAIQLENEMQHSASPWGLTYPGQPYDFTVADRDRGNTHEGVSVASKNNSFAESGNDHMRTLKALALKAGMQVPLFTATGWGYAAIIPNETLPVTAAYAYPTWIAKKELSPFYLYKDLHTYPDYAPVRYNPMDYPAFAAELGSGIMTTYARRPVVPPNSLDALINRCLGGGANGIGYYMYHGGSTPVGEHYFFNDEAYGYPKISYDFQAPIGEYGQVRTSFHRLKLLHYFINEFAPDLAPLRTVLPENNAHITADNLKDLRYAVRTDGNSGFLFLNNFQDNVTTHDQANIRVRIQTNKGFVNIPEKKGITLKAEENLVLPFNFNLSGSNLIYSTAQLLTRGKADGSDYYVFFTTPGIYPEFSFNKTNTSIINILNCTVHQAGGKIYVNSTSDLPASFLITGPKGTKTRVLVISKDLAMKCYLQELKNDRRLIFSDALVLNDGKQSEMLNTGSNNYSFSVYPQISVLPKIDHGKLKVIGSDVLMSTFEVELPKVVLRAEILKTGTRKLQVIFPKSIPDGLNDLFLNVDYIGDTGMAFFNGDLVADEFYKGMPWEIGLKRFNGVGSNKMGFYFRPIMSDAPYLIDLPASIQKIAGKAKETLEIKGVSYTPEYKSLIIFE
ncbi:beta-galactosidase [Mucilaginibacter sp. UYCu711]|uniref:beta-galactosidase n=1 Tax=Mucilaginibacter sp. UYCu711 TaxID=3156339 RepID=UPI003D216641